MRIPCRPRLARALLLPVAWALVACGGKTKEEAGRPAVTPLRRLPLAQVFVLEMGGTPPPDTVAAFPAGLERTIVLRHGAPEQATFAVVTFPDGAFAGGETPEVTLRPRPGVYGLDVSASRPFTGGTISFHYARHFVAPRPAIERYGSDVAFEKTLAVGRLVGDSVVVLLPTRRPASDNVTAELDGPGSYIVAGPR